MGLKNLCIEFNIPSDNLDTETYNSRFRDINREGDNILQTAIELDAISNHQMIVLGGLTTYPQLLGHRFMRRPSNDIDSVITFEGFFNLSNNFKNSSEFFYSSDHDGISLIYNNCPIGFWMDEIRNLKLPKDFYDSAVPIFFSNGQVSCCAPEYTIMLKLRRAKFKKRVYGKDKIDITSLLLAPYFRENLRKVDLDKTSELIKEYLSPTDNELELWTSSLINAEKQLQDSEKIIFREIYERLTCSLVY